MLFELDHVFICTEVGAPEAARLREFGLAEGQPNTHPGQGTANRRFFFHNAMLELLWVHDPEEARSEPTRRTRLWERWSGRASGASPFGLCLRPLRPETKELPFPAWDYRPAFLPEPFVIHVGENSAVLAEPMLFYLAFASRSDRPSPLRPLEHVVGLREITAVRIHHPQHTSPSASLRAAVKTGIVTSLPGAQQLVEIGFDGETEGRSMDFSPELPLVFKW